MADAQLLDRARRANADALLELAVRGDYGSRGYSKSREDILQAASEGLQVARQSGEKRAQAFAVYAVLRFRLLQGEFTSRCQQDALQGTKLLTECGEKKHAGDLQLLMARNSLHPGFDMKPSSALRHASDAFTMFDAQADQASALIVEAEAQLAAKNPRDAIHAAANRAMPLLQGDAAREASAMILCAKAHLLNKDFADAEKSAASAAEKAASDNGLLAAAKAVAAESMLARGDAKGKDAATEALQLARGGDAMVEASLLLLIAKSLLTSSPAEAAENAERAMTIFLLRNESNLEADATHTAAKARLALKDYDAALQLSMQASQTANAFGDSKLEASALHTVSQARLGKNQPGESLLAARKAAEICKAAGDREGAKNMEDAMSVIQQQMPTPHRPTNILMFKEPAGGPISALSTPKHCIVWNTSCKEGECYPKYLIELLRLVDDVCKSPNPLTPMVVCSMGAMARPLGCPLPAQQKDANSHSLFGVVRTVRLEMPRLPICHVDLPTDADGSEIARVICDAVGDSGPRSEACYAKVAGDGKALLEKMGRDTSGM